MFSDFLLIFSFLSYFFPLLMSYELGVFDVSGGGVIWASGGGLNPQKPPPPAYAPDHTTTKNTLIRTYQNTADLKR